MFPFDKRVFYISQMHFFFGTVKCIKPKKHSNKLLQPKIKVAMFSPEKIKQ